ncbi:hypothetical protein AHF37_10076, partial [Paragonimus kellicotti]
KRGQKSVESHQRPHTAPGLSKDVKSSLENLLADDLITDQLQTAARIHSADSSAQQLRTRMRRPSSLDSLGTGMGKSIRSPGFWVFHVVLHIFVSWTVWVFVNNVGLVSKSVNSLDKLNFQNDFMSTGTNSNKLTTKVSASAVHSLLRSCITH